MGLGWSRKNIVPADTQTNDYTDLLTRARKAAPVQQQPQKQATPTQAAPVKSQYTELLDKARKIPAWEREGKSPGQLEPPPKLPQDAGVMDTLEDPLNYLGWINRRWRAGAEAMADKMFADPQTALHQHAEELRHIARDPNLTDERQRQAYLNEAKEAETAGAKKSTEQADIEEYKKHGWLNRPAGGPEAYQTGRWVGKGLFMSLSDWYSPIMMALHGFGKVGELAGEMTGAAGKLARPIFMAANTAVGGKFAYDQVAGGIQQIQQGQTSEGWSNIGGGVSVGLMTAIGVLKAFPNMKPEEVKNQTIDRLEALKKTLQDMPAMQRAQKLSGLDLPADLTIDNVQAALDSMKAGRERRLEPPMEPPEKRRTPEYYSLDPVPLPPDESKTPEAIEALRKLQTGEELTPAEKAIGERQRDRGNMLVRLSPDQAGKLAENDYQRWVGFRNKEQITNPKDYEDLVRAAIAHGDNPDRIHESLNWRVSYGSEDAEELFRNGLRGTPEEASELAESNRVRNNEMRAAVARTQTLLDAARRKREPGWTTDYYAINVRPQTPEERTARIYSLATARTHLDVERAVAAKEQEARDAAEKERQRVAKERQENAQGEAEYRAARAGKLVVQDRRPVKWDTAAAEANYREHERLGTHLEDVAMEHQYTDAADMLQSLRTEKNRGKSFQEKYGKEGEATNWADEALKTDARRREYLKLSDPRALEPTKAETLEGAAQDMRLAEREQNMRAAADKIDSDSKNVMDPEVFEKAKAEADEARKLAEDLRTQRDEAAARRASQIADRQIYPVGAPVDLTMGAATEVLLPSGRRLKAHYAVVPGDQIVTSHNPMTFEWNDDYGPRQAQPRDYSSNQEAQAGVISGGNSPEPDRVHTDDPTGHNGPPVIRKDGLVLGGNGRTMRLQRAFRLGNGDVIFRHLRSKLDQFGLSDMPEMEKKPSLVRVLDDDVETAEDLFVLGRDLNRTETMGFDEAEAAVVAGRAMTDHMMSWGAAQMDMLGEDASVRDFMRARGSEIIQQMMDSGMIEPSKRAAYITRNGEMTEAAKDLFENAWLGKIVDDPDLLKTIPADIKRKLTRGVPGLIRAKVAGSMWDISPEVKEALQLWKRIDSIRDGLNEIGKKGDSLVDRYLKPQDFENGTELMDFGTGTARQMPHPTAEAIAKILEKPQIDVRDGFSDYGNEAEGKQAMLLGPRPEPVDAFNANIGKRVGIEVKPDQWAVPMPEAPKEAVPAAEKAVEPRPEEKAAETPISPPPPLETASRPSGDVVDKLREIMKNHPGIQNVADEELIIADRIVQFEKGMSFADFLKQHPEAMADVTTGEEGGGTGGLEQSITDVANWARRAGGKLSVTPYGEQLDIFGGGQPQYIIRNRSGQERLVLHSELMKLREQVPKVAELVDAAGNIKQPDLFGAEEENLFGPGKEEEDDPQGTLFQVPHDLDAGLKDAFSKSKSVGSKEGDYFDKAKAELFPGRTNLSPSEISRVAARALEMRKASEGPQILFQEKPGPWLYKSSGILEDAKLASSQGGDQWLALLKNRGVKADELKWLGVDDFLAGKKKVSKQELQDFIRENQFTVTEKALSQPKYPPTPTFDGAGGLVTNARGVQYEQYTLPGEKKNYTELLMTLPEKAGERGPKGWGDTGGGTADTANFIPPHFGGEPNLLAHVRFDERTDASGNRVLFVEEVQSDWHQKGKRGGYRTAPETFSQWQKRVSEESGIPVLDTPEERRLWASENEYHALQSGVVPDAPFKTDWHELVMKRMLREAVERGYDKIAWVTGEQTAERYDLSKTIQTIGYEKRGEHHYMLTANTVDGKYLDLGIKREEELADVVGKDIAKKIVDGEGQPGATEGDRMLTGLDLKTGGEWAKNLYDKAIPNFLGKYGKKWGARVGDVDIGKAGADLEYRKHPSGDDTAGWDVIDRKTGQVVANMWSEGAAKSWIADYSPKPMRVHGLDINEEMRKSVMEGQPLFQAKKGAVQYLDDGHRVMHLYNIADASTFLHEFFHVMRPYLSPKSTAVLEKWLKIKDGKWGRQHEEDAARAFEQDFRERNVEKLPPEVKSVFKKIQDAMRKIYEAVIDSKGRERYDLLGSHNLVKASKEVRTLLFDRWYGLEKPPELDTAKAMEKPPEPPKAEKPKFKLGSTQTDIPASSEASKGLDAARKLIADEDTAGKGKDIGGNHVTVRYGIKGEDVEGIKHFLAEQQPFEAQLGKTATFPPTEQSKGAAVIIAPIEAPELHRLNAELEKHGEFIEPTFDYKPHATVAYVKPEAAERYVGMDATEGKKFQIDSITISNKDGSQEVIKLGEPRTSVKMDVPTDLGPKKEKIPAAAELEQPPLSAAEREGAEMVAEGGRKLLDTGVVRAKVIPSWEEAQRWATTNAKKIRSMQLYKLKDGRYVADFIPKDEKVLFQTDETSDINREINALQKRLGSILPEQQRAMIAQRLFDLEERRRSIPLSAPSLEPPPGKVVKLWTAEGDEAVIPKRLEEPPRVPEARPNRAETHDVAKLPEPPRFGGVPERAESPRVSRPEPAPGRPVRSGREVESRGVVGGQPTGTIRGVEPIRIDAPERPSKPPAYSDKDWNEKVKLYGLPPNAPTPTVGISNNLARMLMGGQRYIVESALSGLDRHDSFILAASTGTGKCLAPGTPVLMYDGTIKKIEDIVVGDMLMGPDSKPRAVLSLAHGREEMYRVTPVKGDPYEVNESHILSLKMTTGTKTKHDGKIVNIPITEYVAKSAHWRHCAKGYRVGVEFPEQDVPLPAYWVGAWLGDGTSHIAGITTVDPEVISYVDWMAEYCGLTINVNNSSGTRTPTYILTTGQRFAGYNVVKKKMKDLHLLRNKHIPQVYKANSRAKRLELLAGLIDTDGSPSGGGYDFISKWQRLAEDTAFVARSLGLAAYVTPCVKTCKNNGKKGRYYRVSISGDCSIIPVRIRRKKVEPRKQKKSVLVTGVKVKTIGEGEYFGFQITGDGLFMLGDFTVTHNTYMSSAILHHLLERKPDAQVLILTTSKGLIDGKGGFKDVMGDFGIDVQDLDKNGPTGAPGVYTETWAGSGNRQDIETHPWDLVIADEVQEARKWWSSQRGQRMKEMSNHAHQVLYMSASPFHTALEIGHMDKLGLWQKEGYDNWAKQFGVGKDSEGNYTGGNAPLKLVKLREQLLERGQYINLDKDMEGYSAHFGVVPMDGATAQGLKNIQKAMDLAENYFYAANKRGKVMPTRAQAVTLAKRWLEYQRLPQAIELGKKLQDQGWKVIFFSENKKEFDEVFEFLKEADEGTGGKISQLLPKFRSVTDVLQEHFGDDVGIFAGKHSAARQSELTGFNEGDKKHIYATYGAGGVGVSLHDTVGNAPRAVVYLGPPWSGISFDQALGRPWRYGTRSNVRAYFLFSNAQAEMDIVQNKIAPRMESLRAMVSGVHMTDPIVNALRDVPENREATLDYELGNEAKAGMDQFTNMADTKAVTSYSEMPIVHADEAKNKGMKLPGGEGATAPNVVRLFQDGAEDEVLPAEQEDPRIQSARNINVDIAQEFIDSGAAPGNTGTRNLTPIERRRVADVVMAQAEGAARGTPGAATQAVYTAWQNAMTQIDAILSASSGGGGMEPPPGGVEAPPSPEDPGNLKTLGWYFLTNGRDVIRNAAQAAGVPEIGEKLARDIASYHVYAGNQSGPWVDEYWKILKDNEISQDEHKVLALTMANREEHRPWIDRELMRLRAEIPMNERIARAVDQVETLRKKVFRKMQSADVYLTVYDATTGSPRKVTYQEMNEGRGYWPRKYDYDEVHTVTDPDSGEDIKFTLRQMTKNEGPGVTKREQIIRGMMERHGLTRAGVEDWLGSRKRPVPLVGHVERAREADLPFFRTDPNVMISYLEGAGEVLARKKYFGQDGDKVAGTIAQIPNKKMRDTTKEIIDSLLQRNPMEDESKWLLRMASDWSVLSKMTFSSIKALGHSAHGALSTGLRSYFGGLFEGIFNHSEAQHLADLSGSVMEQTKIEMLSEYGVNKKGLAASVLKYNLWQSAYKFGRVVADANARVFMDKVALPRLLEDHEDIHARRMLKEKMLLDDNRIDEAIARGRWTDEDHHWGAKAFSDKIMYTFDPTELPPAWRSHSEGPISQGVLAATRLATLLRGYQFKTHALLKDDIYDEIKNHNNFRPLIPFLTLYPAMGAIISTLTALATANKKKFKEMLDDKNWTPGKELEGYIDDIAHQIGDAQLMAAIEQFRKGRVELGTKIVDEWAIGAIPSDTLRTLHTSANVAFAKNNRQRKKAITGYAKETFPLAQTISHLAPVPSHSTLSPLPPPPAP
jgi:2'-5' RNA ligase